MVKLIDVVRYNIYTCSESIRQLKDNASKPRKIPNFGLCRFEDTAFRHICPGHPDWKKYQGARRECSLWLVVLHAHKCKKEGELFESAAGDASHLPAAGNGRMRFIRLAKTRHDELCWKVFDGIKSESFVCSKGKVELVTKASPKNYALVEAWVLERNAEREKALALREEVKVHG
jgi:hypothetical protein